MGCELFEIGIREASTGRMMQRRWTRELVQESLPFLKRMNALGNDIFVRPAADQTRHGLVLLDDLKPAALARMERDGRSPAAVVETSPGNFQAWVRVPNRAPEAERGEIARRLAREYEADRASASSHHYGRLAGFTNQKEVHRTREGLHPFPSLAERAVVLLPMASCCSGRPSGRSENAIARAAGAWAGRPPPGRPPRPCNRQRPSSISAGSRS